MLTRRGPGLDKVTVRARVGATVPQLGLPGQPVTISLANAGGTFFTVTVPAAALIPNRSGTAVHFRGTIGGMSVRLRLGGRRCR